MEHPENIPNCSLYQVTPTLKISCNLANRETDKQTDQPTDKDENITFAIGNDNDVVITSNNAILI